MSGLRALERFARGTSDGGRPRPRPGETCELCAAPIEEPHPHVVDLERRALCCSCPTCAKLFASPNAGSRYRAVPDRVRRDAEFALSDEQWSALEIPVGLAFVFFNSKLQRWVAVYPSPAGPTESELGLERWGELARASPLVAAIRPDVEALLVSRPRGGAASAAAECLLVPIDVCYELVALVRRHWEGFEGGATVKRELAAFFERLRARSRPLRRGEAAIR